MAAMWKLQNYNQFRFPDIVCNQAKCLRWWGCIDNFSKYVSRRKLIQHFADTVKNEIFKKQVLCEKRHPSWMVFKVSVQSPILNIGTQVDIVVTFKVLVSGASSPRSSRNCCIRGYYQYMGKIKSLEFNGCPI